jgi:isoleucyl-tRNA synthetase
LNVKQIDLVGEELEEFKVRYVLTPNFKLIGQKFVGDMPLVQKALKELDQSAIKKFKETGKLEILGYVLDLETDVVISQELSGVDPKIYAHQVEGNIVVVVDITLDDEVLLAEGRARDFVSRVQKLRKEAGLKATDQVQIVVNYEQPPEWFNSQLDYICDSLKQKLILNEQLPTLLVQTQMENINISLHKE